MVNGSNEDCQCCFENVIGIKISAVAKWRTRAENIFVFGCPMCLERLSSWFSKKMRPKWFESSSKVR